VEFLTAPPVSLALALTALVLVLLFDKHISQEINTLEECVLRTGDAKRMKVLIMLRLKVSAIWLLFLVPVAATILSLP
jgi:hypothetical protein